ncbi:SDR family NAD(P)-dependent oxidoreductase [Streptomyces sp. NPDC018045]|uniref:SDR family NAD(P)-dependent oxidoreductase n=1 Tax=Streptomyces sp. NPDC018045 TaxID=3365037 RepID=UPI00379B4A2A
MSVDSHGHDSEPVAIVGVACRFPGGIATLNGLWDALAAGRDLITDVPDDRFDTRWFVADGRHPGKSYTAAGGFLDRIRGFDTSFFTHISPREAEWLDPQQRLLLEMAVEALDDAGIAPAALAGSDTSVHVGVSSHDYIDLQTCQPEDNSPYAIAGSAAANTANRISHLFDLRGPSQAIDTACSSALTSVHEACEQVRHGRSRVALAGGINILISPYVYAGFAAASMLSPTDRCRTFSANADGYVRAEGGGLVVLKRLSDALADHDRVHAVIRSSGTNNDGTTPGLAVPNSGAQEALLHQVYAAAGITPDDLVYLEAHGTGTPVGDPAECRAIGRALSARRRTGDALPIGSVKTNMGHLEAASGMAGLLKSLLVLRERSVPPTLHAEPLSPDIDFGHLKLQPALRLTPLNVTERSVVGVNSFGFGGANAHVVLAAPPAPQSRPADGRAAAPPDGLPPALPVLVSGRSPAALRAMAERLATRIEETGATEQPGTADTPDGIADRTDAAAAFYDVAHTTCLRRGHHPYCAAVLAPTAGRAAATLRAVARSEEPLPGGAVEQRTPNGQVAFVFSGNGSQWAGMGADLLTTEPAFARVVNEVDAVLAPRLGWSVRAAMSAAPDTWRLSSTDVAQPLLFALQLGLVAVLETYGIRPAAVVGHSVGETAAACTAGALTLREAAEVVLVRSQAQAPTAGKGRMAAVGMSAETAHTELAGYGGALEIAGINSDRDVTVTGSPEALRDLGEAVGGRGGFFRLLDIDHAFHSKGMDAVEQPMRAALAFLRPALPAVPMASTVTGALVADGELDAAYWWRNVRRPVLFADAVTALRAEGCDIFLEVGPHPVLTGYLRRLTAGSGSVAAVAATCTRDGDGPEALRTAAAHALAAGARAQWDAFFPRPGAVTDLPAYAWQHEERWRGESRWWSRTGADTGTSQDDTHPLLGVRLTEPEPVWKGSLDASRLPWLEDHRIGAEAVLPAAAYVEVMLAVGQRLFAAPVEIDCLDIARALVLDRDGAGPGVRVLTSFSEDDQVVRVTGQADVRAPWLTHARGRVRPLLVPAPPSAPVDAVRERACGQWTSAEHYARAARSGLPYGPAFQVLSELHLGTDEVLAAYRCDLPSDEYQAHPAVLDGALQAGAPLLAALEEGGAAFLPVGIDRVRMWRRPATQGLVHVRSRERGRHEASWDITVTGLDGVVSLELTGCRLRRYAGAAARPPRHLVPALRARPRPGPVHGPSPLPAPEDLRRVTASAGLPAYGTGSGDGRAERTADGFTAAFEEFSAHFAAQALARLVPTGTSFTSADLVNAGMSATYTALSELLLSLAERWHLAERAAGDSGRTTWRLTGAPRPAELLRRTLDRFPGQAMSATLFARCGLHLPQVLTGAHDAIDLLFGEADQHLVEHFYSHYPALHTDHRRAAAVVAALAAAWPADRALRVLEVGAGTGATAARLMPLLPAERTRYVFTDISPAFFARAQARFSEYDFIHYQTLDLNQDPAEQGFDDGSFDLVIATNVLHATADLHTTLARLHRLLADDGQLMAIEIHDAESLALCFGLLDSFWTFTDTHRRTASPLLPARAWPPLLRESGFLDVTRLNDDADEDDPSAAGNHSLLLARRPCRTAPLTQPFETGHNDHWLVVAECPQAEPARHLVQVLTGATDSPVDTAEPGEAASRWPALVPPHAHRPGLVLLLNQPPPGPGDHRAVMDQAEHRIRVLRELARACAALPAHADPTLFVITRPSGALATPETPQAPGDAIAWGASRTLANEQPRLTVRRIALQYGDATEPDAARLVRELLSPDDEDELLLTPGGRFAARLVAPAPASPGADPATAPRVLRVDVPHRHHRLSWEPGPAPRPGPGEVSIAVRAAALNYRDVMMTIGIYPPGGEAVTPDGIALGLECAGEVTAVGSPDTGFAPGDRVYAIASHCLATHVVARADQTGPIPDHMSFTEAATLPVVFLTVQHSLEHLARLAPQETVLIHGAAGGVGLAALQYAHHQGATVIATAGTPAKRDLLRLLGAQHVLDSRSLRFADRIAELTGGRGVDVVLNSIAGEAISRSLEQLRPGGRFVELGKRDIYGNTPLLLRPFRNNLAYFGVDVHQLLTEQLPSVRAAFTRMASRVTDGTYRPLPHQVWPADRVQEAFETMRRSKHLGKAVVSFHAPPPLDRPVRTPRLDTHGTYLITGGLGGLGAATAVELARRGARHLVLAGRRGARTPGAPDLRATLEALGAQVHDSPADITDPSTVRRLLASIEASGHPLRGVVHAAMVLDDNPLESLSDEQIQRVLAPKMLGAMLLDAATRGHGLDFFAVYSSGAGTVGNLQQANYAAANLFLEALTRARRRAGEPSLALAYGPVSDAGYVAREDLTGAMKARGWLPITVEEALGALNEHLCRGTDVVFVDRSDWGRVRQLLPAVDTPRFAAVLPAADSEPTGSADELRQRLLDAEAGPAHALAVETLSEVLAKVLHHAPQHLAADRPLDQLGVDSLMATEVAQAIRHRIGCDFSTLEITNAGDIATLAHRALARIGHPAGNGSAPEAPPTATPPGASGLSGRTP